MKLCIVTHKVAKGDGQGRVNYEVAQAALQRGHQVTVIASQVDEVLQHQPRFDWVPISVETLPTDLLKNLHFANQSARWLQTHRTKFDLVKVNGAITWAAGDVNVAHFVHSAWLHSPAHVWQQRKDLYGLYQWLYTALNARWERRAFAQSPQVIAVSAQVRDDLEKLGILRDRIQVIYNGVDTSEFYPGHSDRTALGLPDSVPLAIFAGDIRSSRKNLDSVLKALVKVSGLHLAVVGNVSGSPYPALAQELAVDDRVHFVGYRQDMADLMRASDFLVFPSRYETFGLVVLEAMASGIPVITSAATPVAELLTDNAGIVLADPDDVPTLVKEMQHLTHHPIHRQQMGIHARAIAEHHSWSQMAHHYIDLFEQISPPC
uniref:Glycosyltransferase family 1 protein n=1 Tax=Oscillatoriales cyanobacterium SpSt-402 TaxID=2282168 RepID=A0A832H3V5_9CYAN